MDSGRVSVAGYGIVLGVSKKMDTRKNSMGWKIGTSFKWKNMWKFDWVCRFKVENNVC